MERRLFTRTATLPWDNHREEHRPVRIILKNFDRFCPQFGCEIYQVVDADTLLVVREGFAVRIERNWLGG